MEYWNNLAARERWLLGTALTLLTIMAVAFLVVRPVLDSKTRAERAHASAQSDLTLIQKNLPLLSGAGTLTTGTQPINRNALLRTAQANGLEMSRLQPENEGAIRVWFEEVTSQQVFKFVSDTTSTYAAMVSAAQITRKKDGKINVTLTFRPVGA